MIELRVRQTMTGFTMSQLAKYQQHELHIHTDARKTNHYLVIDIILHSI